MTTTEPADAQTRAERMRQPLAADVVTAVADQHGVCIRPFTMEVGDPDSGELRYVPMPCGSTVESVCGPCARKARALRMTQCREGWHLTDEPVFEADEPTDEQRAQLTVRADLVVEYRQAVDTGQAGDADELRDAIHEADEELRQLGVRGRLPSPDLPLTRPPTRSTRRRQDAPSLPTRRVRKATVGRQFAGRYRPSMFITLTCDSYGRVKEDGTPVDPDRYDYRRAARDAVHFASLVDRWWQNLRRVVGWDVQYFATVEPQKRAAPHLHSAVRGSIPHEVIRQVTAATYHQVWWPAHDELVYPDVRVPVWDANTKTFVDPDTRQPVTAWADVVDQADEPAHVVRFGRQVHSKGILGGSEEAGRHIGYLAKYLTKSVTEVVEPATDAQHQHADRLPAWLVTLLKAREHVSNPWNVVFVSQLGKLRERSNTNADIRDALDPLGFGWVTSHTFRKTAATLLNDGGLTVREVADQLGHKRVSVTQDTYFGRAAASPKVAKLLAVIDETAS